MILLCMLATPACTQRRIWQESNGAVWNTTYHIVYLAEKNLDDSIQACFNSVAESVSVFSNQSTVSLINRNETDTTDQAFITVFDMARKINRESNGLFDPTVSPLINLWGYGYTGNKGNIPTPGEITTALESVGINQCQIDQTGHITKKSPLTEFNFSALAKGFGCDEIGRMLLRNNCTDYMVEVGGEIAMHGVNPHGRLWHIMIDAPEDNDSMPKHVPMKTVRITDCGVATSGNYRNFQDTPQGRTSHTINPATGYPLTFLPGDTLVLSATVIASTAMEADALATACMCMNPSHAVSMIESNPSRSAMLVARVPGNNQPQTIYTRHFPSPEP